MSLRNPQKISPDLPPPLINGRRRVLVVEDHEDTRLMIRTLLEMQQFEVYEAIDGDAAYEMAVSQQPDLILMDSTLPVGDGVSLTRQIRRHKTIGNVPIIFLTGRAEPARRQAALSAGCNDYLVKPVDLDRMVQVMERWLVVCEEVSKGAEA